MSKMTLELPPYARALDMELAGDIDGAPII